MATKGLYEAPGSMFWLSKAPPSWEGTLLPASMLTYGMMAAGRLAWSDEKGMRSSDDALKRRYSIRFARPHQPIRGSLLVGVLACLMDCWLARWFAGWLVGLLAGLLVGWLAGLLAGCLSGWFAAWLAGCLACRPKSGDRRPKALDRRLHTERPNIRILGRSTSLRVSFTSPEIKKRARKKSDTLVCLFA